jgi:hypothetical protein
MIGRGELAAQPRRYSWATAIATVAVALRHATDSTATSAASWPTPRTRRGGLSTIFRSRRWSAGSHRSCSATRCSVSA